VIGAKYHAALAIDIFISPLIYIFVSNVPIFVVFFDFDKGTGFFKFHLKNYYKLSLRVTFSNKFDNL